MNQRRMKSEGTHILLVSVAFALMLAGVIAVCLLLPHIAYAAKRETVSNLIMLPCAAIALALLMPLLRCAGSRCFRHMPLLLAVSLVCMLMQVYMASRYYFYTDWDVETIVECALSGITGMDISRHANYFSMYQNNLVLVTLFGWVAQFAASIGLAEQAYFALIVFQCLISWGTGALLCCLVRHIAESDFAAAVACLLYSLLIGLSPWVTIPYSDSVALFFPTAILTVYLLMKREGAWGFLRLFLLAFLSYFGYRIKPQVIFVPIAIALVKGMGSLFRGFACSVKDTAKRMAALAIGLAVSALLCNAMAADVDIEIDHNKTFGPAHFLMMGMNTETFGAYYQRDVSSSWWMETKEERDAQNLRIAAERIRGMGPVGFAQQLIRKTLTNYNDGTFCWGYEGIFFREILPEPDDTLSPLLRDLYYGPQNGHTGEYGRYFSLWQNMVQAVWMLVLALTLGCALLKRDERLCIIMLSLMALTAFEALFEARARYLYAYVPLYITLAACGLEALVSRLYGLPRRNDTR